MLPDFMGSHMSVARVTFEIDEQSDSCQQTR